MKALQLFSSEYLKNCRSMSAHEIIQFLADFGQLHNSIQAPSSPSSKSKLISIKIPENLLSAFRIKAGLAGKPYQTQIKQLMVQWLFMEVVDSRMAPPNAVHITRK